MLLAAGADGVILGTGCAMCLMQFHMAQGKGSNTFLQSGRGALARHHPPGELLVLHMNKQQSDTATKYLA